MKPSIRAREGQFDDVDASADLQFPERLPTMREMQMPCGAPSRRPSRPRIPLAAQAGLTAAKTIAILGAVLGALGLATGVGAVVIARKR